MKYAVNEAGVQALNAMADAVVESVQQILALSVSAKALSDSYSDTIGPHKASLDLAIEEITKNIRQAAGPVDDIAEKLADMAEAYEEIIGNDRIKAGAANMDGGKSSGGGAPAGTAAAKGSSFFGALFRRRGKDEAERFGGFDTGKLKNGTTVLKGSHYDQYIQEYYDPESLAAEPVTGGPAVEVISPSDIEGVHLGDEEVKDPGVFWSMHNSSEEFFAETASHIPAVQAALDSGCPLEDLKDDPALGTCARIFFDPEKMPRVEKCDGYYTFSGDGRHRIVTARKLGYDIPVRVTSIRRHK